VKILHIFPYCPVPPQFGGALRIYNLLRLMAERHDVTVAYYGYPESVDLIRGAFDGRVRKALVTRRGWHVEYKRLGQIYSLVSRRSQFFNMGWTRRLEEMLRRELESGGYDLIQTEFSHMASFDLPAGIPKILDAHNVEFDLIRRQGEGTTSLLRKLNYNIEYRKLYHDELAACKKHDHLMVTSERDRELFDRHLPGMKKSVLPNGVDSTFFSPGKSEPEPRTLVFTGLMNYLPNNTGVQYFLKRIFPLILKRVPDVRLLVVGANPPPSLVALGGENVTFTGRVDDIRPYVHRAQVAVVPLTMGGGTRLKILESFAMKKPVVSTTIGAEGLDARHGESILLADEPEAFAGHVVSLLENRALRERLAANAYELMKTTYEWSVLGDLLERTYDEVLSGSAVSPRQGAPRPENQLSPRLQK